MTMHELFSSSCANTVRGLSFHPSKPWILAGLDTGDIQIWDYNTRCLENTFKAHKGPVRSVHFHTSLPIFVSAGDDRKIVMWNYKDPMLCPVTLHGHRGRINSVQFHHQLPWIVSASSDRTVRIWDWISQKCVYKLRGHWDGVTSACFHQIEPFILSASLDYTIRVWDIRCLKDNPISSQQHRDVHWSEKIFRWLHGGAQHVLSYVSEGIPSAAFHPTLLQICATSNYGGVQTWRWSPAAGIGDNSRGEWKRLPVGIVGNEHSSVLFHDKLNLVVAAYGSCIAVADAEKRNRIKAFHCGGDVKSIQVLTSHPNKNLLAAGHSNGILVFKLGRDFPVFCANDNYLYHIRGNFLWAFDLSTQKKLFRLFPVLEQGTSSLCRRPEAMSCSSTKTAVVICSQGGSEASYKLYNISKGLGGGATTGIIAYEEKSGIGLSAVFVSEDKFAVLEKRSDYLLVRKLDNNPCSVIALPTVVDAIFNGGGTWRVLCRSNDRVFLWDIGSCSIVGDLPNIPYTRRVVWRNDMKYVAFLGKRSIVIADSCLVKKCEIHETSNVKSGIWSDVVKAFVYATLEHIKDCRLNGETKVLMTLDSPRYPTTIVGNKVLLLDRGAELHSFHLRHRLIPVVKLEN